MSSCMRIVSNQTPSEAMLATSCRVRATRCAGVIRSHSAVPHRLDRSGGTNHPSGTSGASQSISTSGSYECSADDRSRRVAVASRSVMKTLQPLLQVTVTSRIIYRMEDDVNDGRRGRWADHREQRRTQLTVAAIDAIRELGPDVGMDAIAAHAGIS